MRDSTCSQSTGSYWTEFAKLCFVRKDMPVLSASGAALLSPRRKSWVLMEKNREKPQRGDRNQVVESGRMIGIMFMSTRLYSHSSYTYNNSHSYILITVAPLGLLTIFFHQYPRL